MEANSTKKVIQWSNSVRFVNPASEVVGNTSFNHKRGKKINKTNTTATARLAKSEDIPDHIPSIQRYLEDHKSKDSTK
jgi:hypothetical protein